MSKMMDIREKIIATLDQKPGYTFSVSQIVRTIGSSPKSTVATLSRLFKAGLVARPQKGVYSSKGRRPEATRAPEPAKPRKIARIPKTAKPAPAPTVVLSVVTIDLLVQGEKSRIDVGALLGNVRGDKAILDARVRKVTEADQSKLQIRFALADED